MIFLELTRAFRRLTKAPGFSLTTILIFAVGIGLSLYIYTFINSLLYAKVEFPDSERMIFMERKSEGQWRGGASHYTFQELNKNQKIFEDFGGLRMWWWATITSDKDTTRAWTAYTTPSMFDMLQVSPILGRTLQAEDDIAGAEKVVVISHDIWQQVFDGSEDVIGKSTLIGGIPHTVVGVMPEDFGFPVNHKMWIPLQLEKTADPFWSNDLQLTMFGKLNKGQTSETAKSQLDVKIEHLKSDFPDYYADITIDTFPITRYFFRDADDLKFLLFAIAGAIMFLVCFNVGNLLFARANENIKEVAIRSALGAPRFMLMQQVLAESLILCVSGAFWGILLASIFLSLTDSSMAAVFSVPSPYWLNFDLDFNSILFAIVATIFAWLAAGIYPAWKASGTEFNEALKDSNKGGGGGGSNRLTGVIVTIQIFLSSVLVSFAVDSVFSLQRILNTDFGVDISRYTTGQLIMGKVELPTIESRLQFFERFAEELENEPGILQASAASQLVGEHGRPVGYNIEEADLREEGRYPELDFVLTQNDYFSTIGVNLLAGRNFDQTDTVDTPSVGIIHEDFANKLWGKDNPIGKRIEINPKGNSEWVTIVGVVSPFRQAPSVHRDFSRGNLYRPFSQTIGGDYIELKFIAKVEGDPTTYDDITKKAAWRVNPLVNADALLSLEERIDKYTMFHRFMSSMFFIFGTISLILAATGIYSISSRAAVLRTHEFGIRRALGASDFKILSLLMTRATLHLSIGLLLGLATTVMLFIALAHTDMTQKIIMDTLVSFSAVAALTAVTVFAASFFPARRAIALQPSVALHHE